MIRKGRQTYHSSALQFVQVFRAPKHGRVKRVREGGCSRRLVYTWSARFQRRLTKVPRPLRVCSSGLLPHHTEDEASPAFMQTMLLPRLAHETRKRARSC